MKYAITIARTYGSGGKEIGKKIAELLNINYCGHEKLSNEKSNDYIDDEAISYSLILKDGEVDFEAEDRVFKMHSEAIRKLASESSCIIVGRCADYALKDFDNVVRVFITADFRDCMRRVMQLYELNPEDAKQLIQTMNKSRGEYYKYHTGQERDNASNYDLSINVSGMDIDVAADIIIDYVKKKLNI